MGGTNLLVRSGASWLPTAKEPKIWGWFTYQSKRQKERGGSQFGIRQQYEKNGKTRRKKKGGTVTS